MPSTSTLVDSIYTRRVSDGECDPPDLVKSQKNKTYLPVTIAYASPDISSASRFSGRSVDGRCGASNGTWKGS